MVHWIGHETLTAVAAYLLLGYLFEPGYNGCEQHEIGGFYPTRLAALERSYIATAVTHPKSYFFAAPVFAATAFRQRPRLLTQVLTPPFAAKCQKMYRWCVLPCRSARG